MDRRLFVRHCLMAAASAPFLPESLQSAPLIPSNSNRLTDLSEQPLRRIAFGSCNYQTKDQNFWPLIARENPQLWIWLGDNIYADKADLTERGGWYESLKQNPYYRDFIGQVPVIGTWDDHDYWNENADGTYADKDGSKELMLNFLDVPADSPIRSRPGVYQSRTFGPSGQRTQVILLDLRYFQNRAEKTLLGAAQWQFLEDEIKNSTADLLIIGSSLNVCSPVSIATVEGWRAFPEDRQRLYDLLASHDIPTVLLSGDRHMGEMYRVILGNGKPVYEVMSSGLTHALGVKLPSGWRIGEMVGRKNFGFIGIDWTSTGPQVGLRLQSTERLETYGQLQTSFT